MSKQTKSDDISEETNVIEQTTRNSIDWDEAAQDMSFADEGEIIEERCVIHLTKPSKERFFRVKKGSESEIIVQTLTVKDDQDLRGDYLVPPNTGPELKRFFDEQINLIKRKKIVCCTDARGQIWLWPVAPVNSDNLWHRSARKAAESAKENWVRMVPGEREYRLLIPTKSISEPTWPSLSFKELLDSAFEGRVINSMDHPVVEYLNGPGQSEG